MTSDSADSLTELLRAWKAGDPGADERLLPRIYPELRKIARGLLSIERPGHTLQPTALVHETYLRLLDQRQVRWQDRHQFFAVSARLAQRILVDHARRRLAVKRGGALERVDLSAIVDLSAERPDLLIQLDEALDSLESLDRRQATIVRARFFAGLTGEEIAEALDVSPATVKRQWRLARAWLYRQLESSLGGETTS